MKVRKKELVDKINMVKGVIVSRTTLPILQCISVREGYLIASNGEMLLQVELQGSEGESLILTPSAYALIPEIDSDEIEITQDNKQQLSIKGGKTISRFASFDPETYPYALKEESKEDTTVTVDAEDFTEAIKQVIWAVDDRKDEHRPMMRSIGIETRGEMLNFCGISNAQLAWCQYPYNEKMEMALPATAARRLVDLEPQGKLVVAYNSKVVKFVTTDMIMIARLGEGKFMNYQTVFNNPLPSEAKVNKTDLLKALKRIILVRQNEQVPTVMTLKGDVMSIAVNDTSAQMAEDIALEGQATQELRIGMNPRLVLKALKAIPEEAVTIKYDGATMPLYMTGGGFALKALTLPVHLNK